MQSRIPASLAMQDLSPFKHVQNLEGVRDCTMGVRGTAIRDASGVSECLSGMANLTTLSLDFCDCKENITM